MTQLNCQSYANRTIIVILCYYVSYQNNCVFTVQYVFKYIVHIIKKETMSVAIHWHMPMITGYATGFCA